MNEEIDLVNIERIDMKVIITDCDQVILTYLQAETVANRLDEDKDYEEDEDDEE